MKTTSDSHPDQARRVVLIDFDWEDADLVPALVKCPELSIRLVAGARQDDPGLRVAELCGLPSTVDLGDLTREIFDLALVSERSTRRTQIEGLLRVLGTPCATPQSFLDGSGGPDEGAPAIEAPIALHAAALETSLGGSPIDDMVEEALPDLTQEPSALPPDRSKARPSGVSPVVQSLEDFPSPEDRLGLENALTGLMSGTGATAAELQTGRSGRLEVIAQVGPEDELMKGLVDLALRSEEPQVVQRLSGPDEGRAWGAWPFRTGSRKGVLAAAGIDPAVGWMIWEKTVEELRTTWDQREREQADRAGTPVPEVKAGWLGREQFLRHVELAVERNHRDGLRFSLRRITFPEVQLPVEQFCSGLAAQLRETDVVCRPGCFVMLHLAPYRPSAQTALQKRVQQLFERAWREAGPRTPLPTLGEEELVLERPEESADFVQRTKAWLGLG